MDFVEGEILDPLEDPMRVKLVAGILDHLVSFSRIIPGLALMVPLVDCSSIQMKGKILSLTSRILNSGGTAECCLMNLRLSFKVLNRFSVILMWLREIFYGKAVKCHVYLTGLLLAIIQESLNSVHSLL